MKTITVLQFKGKGSGNADFVKVYKVLENEVKMFIKKNTDKESKYWSICVEDYGQEIDTHFCSLSQD